MNLRRTCSTNRRAVTALEVLIVLATLLLFVALFFPFQPRGGSSRSVRCMGNLKTTALGFILFANDGETEFPWRTPAEKSGTIAFANSPEVWHHFAAASNISGSPKVLLCPADRDRSAAAIFAALRNTNISYFIALDAGTNQRSRWLVGDRAITGGTLSNGFLRSLASNSKVAWAAGFHPGFGTIALTDGSAHQVNNDELQQRVSTNDLPVIRLAIP